MWYKGSKPGRWKIWFLPDTKRPLFFKVEKQRITLKYSFLSCWRVLSGHINNHTLHMMSMRSFNVKTSLEIFFYALAIFWWVVSDIVISSNYIRYLVFWHLEQWLPAIFLLFFFSWKKENVRLHCKKLICKLTKEHRDNDRWGKSYNILPQLLPDPSQRGQRAIKDSSPQAQKSTEAQWQVVLGDTSSYVQA